MGNVAQEQQASLNVLSLTALCVCFQYFKGTIGLQPGDSALFINGLHIDLDTQDIFRYG